MFCCAGTCIWAQYLPTLEDEKTWMISNYYHHLWDWRFMAEIYLDGEEVFEGVTYKVLKVYSEVYWDVTFGLIREDTLAGQLWFRSHLHWDQNYMGTSREVLLADYSLQPGDEFYYTYFRTYAVDAGEFIFITDSLLLEVEEASEVNGRIYIQLNTLSDEAQNFFNYNYYYNPAFQYPAVSQVPLHFIEGIGPSFGLSTQCLPVLNDQHPEDPYLLCAYVDGMLVWNDPYVDSCYYENELPLVTAINDESRYSDNESIMYPNPVHDVLYFKTLNELPLRVQLSDLSGKILIDKIVNPTTESIPVQHLPQGTYIVRIISQLKPHSQLILKL